MATNRPSSKKFLEMVARVQLIGNKRINVGVPKANDDRKEEEGDDSGINNAQLMALHEYGGTLNIPERQGSITRQLRKDGSFAYSGRIRKNGNFQSFHTIPAHTVVIPERSVFRYTFHKNKFFRDAAAKMAKKVAEGSLTVTRGTEQLGMLARDKVRLSFTDGHLQPNAPSTIKKKGSSKPLIDTGQLRQSITYVVKEGK